MCAKHTSIGFVAVVIIVMTTLVRGLMRTVPDNILVLPSLFLPLLLHLLLLSMSLLPVVRAEAAEDRASECAKLVAVPEL